MNAAILVTPTRPLLAGRRSENEDPNQTSSVPSIRAVLGSLGAIYKAQPEILAVQVSRTPASSVNSANAQVPDWVSASPVDTQSSLRGRRIRGVSKRNDSLAGITHLKVLKRTVLIVRAFLCPDLVNFISAIVNLLLVIVNEFLLESHGAAHHR